MKEVFPDKQPGDNLSAGHINKLNRVGRIVTGGQAGAFTFGGEGHAAGPVPWIQTPVEITDDTHPRAYYKCKPLYYDPDENDPKDRWKVRDDDNEYDLDYLIFGGELFWRDRINVYWDPQRGAYLPCTPLWRMHFCVSLEDIDGSTSGRCQFRTGTIENPDVLTHSNSVEVERYCFNRWGTIYFGTPCLAIPFAMMGFDPVEYEGETDNSSDGSSGSAEDLKSLVMYELTPLMCEPDENELNSSASSPSVSGSSASS